MSENKTLERSSDDATNEWRVGPGMDLAGGGVISLPGCCLKWKGWPAGAFDFTTLGGAFGTMKTPKLTLLSAAAASAPRPVSCLRCRWSLR